MESVATTKKIEVTPEVESYALITKLVIIEEEDNYTMMDISIRTPMINNHMTRNQVEELHRRMDLTAMEYFKENNWFAFGRNQD